MSRRKLEPTALIERFKNERLYNYFVRLLEQLNDHAPLLVSHILEEMVSLRTKDKENVLEGLVDVLEEIVPMSEKEYRYSLSVLYKLLYRTDHLLAVDIIQAFEADVKNDYDVDNVMNVSALDRREVVRRLANLYRGLIRFKVLDKQDKAEVRKASASSPAGTSLARDLFNQSEI